MNESSEDGAVSHHCRSVSGFERLCERLWVDGRACVGERERLFCCCVGVVCMRDMRDSLSCVFPSRALGSFKLTECIAGRVEIASHLSTARLPSLGDPADHVQ